MALSLQLNGLIVAYQFLEARRNVAIGFYKFARKIVSFERKKKCEGDFFPGNQKLFGLQNAELYSSG